MNRHFPQIISSNLHHYKNIALSAILFMYGTAQKIFLTHWISNCSRACWWTILCRNTAPSQVQFWNILQCSYHVLKHKNLNLAHNLERKRSKLRRSIKISIRESFTLHSLSIHCTSLLSVMHEMRVSKLSISVTTHVDKIPFGKWLLKPGERFYPLNSTADSLLTQRCISAPTLNISNLLL